MSTGRIKKKSSPEPVSKMPVIGNIRIGEKVPGQNGGKEYPVSLDYFKATGNYAEKFKEEFGPKPTKIPIMFPTEDVSDVCNERLEAWEGGKRLAYGNGIDFNIFDNDKKDYIKITLPENAGEPGVKLDPKYLAIEKKLKRILTLRFIIPSINGVYGAWRFDTSADKTSIDAITSIFDYVKSQAGRVSLIPFDLIVEMHDSKTPNEKKKYPIVQLIPNLGQESIEQISQFLSGIGNVSGLLTEERIKQLVSETNVKNEKPIDIPVVEEVKAEIINDKKDSGGSGLFEGDKKSS